MRSRSVDHLVAHVVWTVSLRRPLLLPRGDGRLRDLLSAKAHDVDARLLAAGFAADHVHALVRFPAARPLSEVVQRMKGASSRALRLEAPDDDFGWQDGYWARSCDPGDLDDVTRYVLRQREHHAHAAAPEPWEAASAEDA